MPAYRLQQGLLGRVRDRRVVGTRPRFDDASRDQFARPRSPNRFPHIEVETISGVETSERRFQAERRIRLFGVAPERLTMPHLLNSPIARGLLKRGIVGEDVAQIASVFF